jgi:hypothetical protein
MSRNAPAVNYELYLLSYITVLIWRLAYRCDYHISLVCACSVHKNQKFTLRFYTLPSQYYLHDHISTHWIVKRPTASRGGLALSEPRNCDWRIAFFVDCWWFCDVEIARVVYQLLRTGHPSAYATILAFSARNHERRQFADLLVSRNRVLQKREERAVEFHLVVRW